VAFPLLPALLVLSAALAAAKDPCGPRRERASPDAASMHEAEVLYLPTPPRVVRGMLRFAAVSAADVVYDLGSGDGRIPIAAAREFGARGVGIELDGRRIAVARCLAREARVEHRVEFREADLFDADLRDATVVTLFLFPEINRRLAPKLRAELRPGTRIVSHRFDLGDWPPDAERDVDGHRILLWTVPAR
jgi:SAM-dependent methyltransferase